MSPVAVEVHVTTQKVIARERQISVKWEISRFVLSIDGISRTAMLLDMKSGRRREVDYEKALARVFP